MYSVQSLYTPIVELIKKVSVTLPEDIIRALKIAAQMETPDSTAGLVLSTILENVSLAKQTERPICQDTGVPNFFIRHPKGLSRLMLDEAISMAVKKASDLGYLRPNAIDSLTQVNSGNNIGQGLPVVYCEESNNPDLSIQLLLKGGGSENVSTQYALPYSPLNAQRDEDGIRKVCLDAVYRAQGLGCAPGVLGVCIGGDRALGYAYAKRQLLRSLEDTNPNPNLARLEKELLDQSNSLEIGPMGLGGRTTLLGVKIGGLHRHPACFFVTVSYMCWALRRGHLLIREKGEISYE
jgi:fumarate hydratase class I